MILIVAHHYVVNSGLLDVIKTDNGSLTSYYYWTFGAWGKTGINCFVFITGFFMCKSKITLEKFLKLLFQILFYKIIIGIIFFVINYKGYSSADLIADFLPVKSVKTGFVSCFVLFWLTIPFLNRLLQNISRKEHGLLILLCLFIYTFSLYIPFGEGVNMNYVSWFIVLYFISSYVRLYPNNVYKSDSSTFWGELALFMFLLSILSIWAIVTLNCRYGQNINPHRLLSDSNALFALLLGLSSFMFFKNLRISYCKRINTIAASTFGVLLIHANSDSMRMWLWKDVIDCVGHYSSEWYVLYSFFCVISIFLVCVCIDFVRIHTVEKWIFLYLKSKFLH